MVHGDGEIEWEIKGLAELGMCEKRFTTFMYIYYTLYDLRYFIWITFCYKQNTNM